MPITNDQLLRSAEKELVRVFSVPVSGSSIDPMKRFSRENKGFSGFSYDLMMNIDEFYDLSK